jgi:hypothetical protein
MSKLVEENQHSILRYLYHHRGSYKSRREIENGTGLTEAQVRYALDDIIPELVEKKESETRGDIQNAYVYTANSAGREYVENEIDEIPQEQRNREEIEKIAKRVMSLNSKIRRYKDELEDWKQYTEEHTEATENRVRDIEDELD